MNPTFAMNENYAYIITLFRKGKRVIHIFRDHWLSIHKVEENGRGMLYYLIAHDYGTGEEIFVWLKDKYEFDILNREFWRGEDEAANFKKALYEYNGAIALKN